MRGLRVRGVINRAALPPEWRPTPPPRPAEVKASKSQQKAQSGRAKRPKAKRKPSRSRRKTNFPAPGAVFLYRGVGSMAGGHPLAKAREPVSSAPLAGFLSFALSRVGGLRSPVSAV